MESSNTLMHPFDHGFDVALDDPVELEGLARRDLERRRGHVVGELVEDEPLLRRRASAGQPHAQHERERLLLAGFLERVAQVAVVLEIEAVEFA